MAAFMDAFALSGIPVIGHSSGGAAAVYLAATRPEYVSKLVLIEPIIMPAGIRWTRTAAARWPTAPGSGARYGLLTSEMVAAYRQRSTFEHWREDVLQLYAEEGTFLRERRPDRTEMPRRSRGAGVREQRLAGHLGCPPAG